MSAKNLHTGHAKPVLPSPYASQTNSKKKKLPKIKKWYYTQTRHNKIWLGTGIHIKIWEN